MLLEQKCKNKRHSGKVRKGFQELSIKDWLVVGGFEASLFRNDRQLGMTGFLVVCHGMTRDEKKEMDSQKASCAHSTEVGLHSEDGGELLNHLSS